MNGEGVGPGLLGARYEAILLVFATTGHTQQACGLVEHKQVLIGIDHVEL
jgi:hypothetical protein